MPDQNEAVVDDVGSYTQKLIRTPTFLGLSESDQQDTLRNLQKDASAAHPGQAPTIAGQFEAINTQFRQASGQGRYIPSDDLASTAPWNQDDYGTLSEDEKVNRIEQFRKIQAPIIAESDPINRKDIEFHLSQLSDNAQRHAQGDDTGWLADKGYRAFDGFAAGMADFVGATDTAESIHRWTAENPKYDGDLGSMVAEGAGNMAASTAIFLGAAALAGETGGTSLLLLTSGISRYNQGYKESKDKGYSEEVSNRAGLYSLPAAAFDVLASHLIGAKFLPSKYGAGLKSLDDSIVKNTVIDILNDNSMKSKVMAVARDAFNAATPMVAAQGAQGLGAYVATGDDEFLPTPGALGESFVTGAILGGIVAGGEKVIHGKQHADIRAGIVDNLKNTDQEISGQVGDLLKAGKYSEAYALTRDAAVKTRTNEMQRVLGEQQAAETGQPVVVPPENPGDAPYVAKGQGYDPSQPIDSPSGIEETKPFLPASNSTPEEQTAAEFMVDNPVMKVRMNKALQQEFVGLVEDQANAYNPETIGAALDQKPSSFNESPIRGIRAGITENPSSGALLSAVKHGDLVQKVTNDYSNIKLIDPTAEGAILPKKGVADMTVLDRGKAQGDAFNVAPSPGIGTKIEEEIAIGKDITLLAPIDEKQDVAIGNRVPRIDLEKAGATIGEYQDVAEGTVSGKYHYAETDDSIKGIADQLDEKYGKDQWVVKDSRGAASEGIHFGRDGLEEAFQNSTEGLDLQGMYAEPYNDEIFGDRKEYRVHVMKREGKLEAIPYATHAKGNALPYVVRTPEIEHIEKVALDHANKAKDQIAENGLLGVDVVSGPKGYVASELNPTQFGQRAEELGSTGASGYVQTPYVAAAMYSHLKGQVPAFVMVARPILRNKIAMEGHVENLSDGISRAYANAKDKAQLKSMLLKSYGERFADRVDEIWTGFRDSVGKITDSIKNIIRDILTKIGLNPSPEKKSWMNDDGSPVSPQNQPLMDQIDRFGQQASDLVDKAVTTRENLTPTNPQTLDEDAHYTSPEDPRFNLPLEQGENKYLFSIEDTQKVVNDLVGSTPANVKIINDPSIPWAGKISGRRDILLNSARLTGEVHAREVLIHEAVHAVWKDPDIAGAWNSIIESISPEEIQSIKDRYGKAGIPLTDAIALEEVANEKVMRQYAQENGPVRNFVDKVWGKIKELFGIEKPDNLSDAARIMHKALMYLKEEASSDSKLKPSQPVNRHVFSNGQVAGPGNFFITAGHIARREFAETEANPLGEFSYAYSKKGTGYQYQGYGHYFFTSKDTGPFYRDLLSRYADNQAITYQARINTTQDRMLHWNKPIKEQSKRIKDTLGKFLGLDPSEYPGSVVYNAIANKLGNPRLASEALNNMGIHGIEFEQTEDRAVNGSPNYVVFDPSKIDIQSLEEGGEKFDLSTPGDVWRVDPDLYSIPEDAVPEKESKRRWKEIRTGNIADRFDGNTGEIRSILNQIKPSDVKLLLPEHQKDFFDLINHIYEARSTQVNSPEARIKSDSVISELRQHKNLFDSAWIKQAIKDNDGLLDLSDYEKNGGDMNDRDAFKAFLNSVMEKEGVDMGTPKNAAAQQRFEEKQEEWRNKYKELADEVHDTHGSAEAWIKSVEEDEGGTFKSPILRDFLGVHYDYMTSLADTSTLSGRDLYKHYHALNNLSDGNLMYAPETTVQYIKNLRDSKVDVEKLKTLFRDPVITRNGFLEGMDRFQMMTELKQTQLDRFSAFTDGKKFLQEDLMGDLYKSILGEAANHQADTLRRYNEGKKLFEENVGRKMSGEDKIVMSMMSRLMQYKSGDNPDTAFKANLANEQKALDNVIGGKRNSRASIAMQEQARDIVQPILDQLTIGLDQSVAPMQDFMTKLNYRAGLGKPEIGQQRVQLLDHMIGLMDEYSTDAKFATEGFHQKPFEKYVNYLPRRAIPLDPERTNTRTNELTDEVGKFEDQQFQNSGMTGEIEQQKARVGIGNNSHYSNNIEYVFERGVRMNSLIGSTTSERFILDARLKGDQIVSNLVDEGDDRYRRSREMKDWASSLFRNAMHSGNSLGSLGRWMKAINSAYSRVALSGLHQGVSQVASGAMDYHVRTNNLQGFIEASTYYAQHTEEATAWLEQHAARITNRSYMGEQELDRRRTPAPDPSGLAAHPLVQKLNSIVDGAGDVLTYSLRKGDDFVARAMTIAEYSRLMKKKGAAHETLSDMDWEHVDQNAMTQAQLTIERNMNSNDKITRGELFTDRVPGIQVARNVLLAFSSASMTLASQFSLAARDLIELHQNGGSREEKLLQVRTMGAVLAQTATFASSRYVLNGILATGMIGLMRSMFNDKDGHISDLQLKLDHAKETGDDVAVANATYDLQAAQNVAQDVEKFQNKSLSFDGFFKNVLKEELGSVNFVFAGPGLPQKVAFMVADSFGEKMQKEEKGAQSSELAAKIKQLKEDGKFGQAAQLTETKTLIDGQEYIPFNQKQFDNIGIGGLTGTTLTAGYSSLKEANEAMQGLKEWNWTDAVVAAQSAGFGQADVNRFLRAVDKIENDQFTLQQTKQEKIDKATARQQEQDGRARKVRLTHLLNIHNLK